MFFFYIFFFQLFTSRNYTLLEIIYFKMSPSRVSSSLTEGIYIHIYIQVYITYFCSSSPQFDIITALLCSKLCFSSTRPSATPTLGTSALSSANSIVHFNSLRLFHFPFVLCFLSLRSCFSLYSFGILWPTHCVKRSKHQKRTSK